MLQAKLTFLSFLALTVSATSCKHKPNEVLGCMDATALNYNPKATVGCDCVYKQVEDANKQYVGSYCVKDTVVYFNHDTVRGWYDTFSSSVIIKVCAVKKDSLVFDNILNTTTFPYGGLKFNKDCSGFSYTDYQTYYSKTASGGFSGDTLRYIVQCAAPLSSNTFIARWGTGIKYK